MKLRSAHHITSHQITLPDHPDKWTYRTRILYNKADDEAPIYLLVDGRSTNTTAVGLSMVRWDFWFVLFHLVITHQNTTHPQYCSDAWISSPYPIFVISFILKILPEWLRNAFLSFFVLSEDRWRESSEFSSIVWAVRENPCLEPYRVK